MSDFFVELNVGNSVMNTNAYAACDMGDCFVYNDSCNVNWDVDCYEFKECYEFNPNILWDDTPSTCYDGCDSSCDAGCY